MQNQNTTPAATTATTRAALIARRERALADFCQLALDDRSTPEGLSEDARAEMNALEEELASIHQQLNAPEAEQPASGEQAQTATATALAINARLEKITRAYRALHLAHHHSRLLGAEQEQELAALQTDLNGLYLQFKEAERQARTEPATPGAYNGYANGDTYTVARHISNSASASEIAAAIVAGAWNTAADRIAEDRAAIVAPRADAADALREWLEEENPLADAGGLYNDLITHALARVDWGDIADHFAPNPLPSIEPIPYEDDPSEDGKEDAEQPEEPEGEWREWLRERD